MDSNINIKQADYIHKCVEVKKEYVEDIKNMLMLNNNEKLIPIIKEYNESFMNKLSLLFKDIIPKEHLVQTQYLQSLFKSIEQTLMLEMSKGITQNSLDNITHTVEQKITQIIVKISEQKTNENQLHFKIDDMLNKLTKNNDKGKVSENLLNINLQSIYPNAEIINVSNTPHSGDFWLIRKDKPSIIIENKNHDGKVYKDDVQKFIDDMNDNNMCGIMVSQKSPIVYRDNYEIEIHNGNVAVYIHECNYDPLKIKIAVQIIDTFKLKIEKQKIENGTSFTIELELLEKINKEYQLFNIKKTQHCAEIKHMYDTLLKSAEEMELESLELLLESQGLLTNIKKFVCNTCPRSFKTQKGLDTHQRLCYSNNGTSTNSGNKNFKCEYCDEVIKTPKGLRSHCLKKHNVEISTELTI